MKAPRPAHEKQRVQTRRRSQTERQTAAQLKRVREELAWKRAFLEAQVNSSPDGVLVVDEHGKKLLQNQRMIDLWKMPRPVADEITDENRLRWVAGLVKHPGPFVKKVVHLYAHPEEISQDEIELKDGTTVDRYSAPVLGKEGKYYGRIWTFRDITGRKRSEAALKESESRYRSLFENMLEGYAYCQTLFEQGKLRDFIYLEVNGAFEKLTGLQGVVGKKVSEVIPGIQETNRELFELYSRVALTGRPEKCETYVEGLGIWLSITVYGRAGKRFVAIFDNITVRKQTEAARDRLAAILEATPDLVAVADPAGHLLYLNLAGRTLLGVGVHEDITNTSISDIIPNPASHPILLEGIPSAIRQGTWSGETVLLNRRGHEFPVSQVILAHQAPDGKLEFLSTIMRDISERTRAEVELAIFVSMLNATLESTLDGIRVVDGRGRLVNFNRKFAEMWRIPREILDARDDERALAVMISQLKNPGAFLDKARELEARPEADSFDVLELKDGRILERYSQPQRVDQSIVGRVWCFRDVTERMLAAARLAETHHQLLAVSRQAGMAEFATGILHNVGNVLSSVSVASTCVADSLRRSKAANLSKVVGLLQEHQADLGTFLTSDPKGRQVPVYLGHLAGQLAGEQAAALNELAELQKNIEHIRDIVTTQQGMAKTSGAVETVNVTELVEDAVRMNPTGVAPHRIEVIKECGDLPPVQVEKPKALQILVNLVRNANQSCAASDRPGKRVTIRATAGHGLIRIAVSDNGVGIPPENLTRIFTHGFTTKKDGHGFGLHGSALAARELGGSLTVQSDGPGHGATFVLELPVKPETPAA